MQARHAAAVTPARGVAGGRSSKATPRSAAPRRALAQPPRAAGQGPLDGIIEDPLLRRALREPVAFAGGMLAGFLKLDLGADPLADWVRRTAAVAGPPPTEPPAAADGGAPPAADAPSDT